MIRSKTSVATACVAVIAGAVLAAAAGAAPVNVRLDTSARMGDSAQVSFEMTSNNKRLNTANAGYVFIYDFTHNGTFGYPASQGGDITGDLVLGLNPAFYSSLQPMSADGFYFAYTQLGLNFAPLGGQITFSSDLSSFSLGESSLLEQLSFFVLKPNGTPLIHSADPFGTHALFTLEGLNLAETQLQVFAPAVFVPPDSVVLSFSILDVPATRPLDRFRLQMSSANPSVGPVHMRLAVPGNPGRTRIDLYDATGRRVRALADDDFAPGWTDVTWDGMDQRGARVGPGVYWLVVRGAGQSLSQRLIRLH